MNSKTYSDFGVRKYDVAGRFLSIDPLWEKYLAWSPYHYCGNNPINGKDPSGLDAFLLVWASDKDKEVGHSALAVDDNSGNGTVTIFDFFPAGDVGKKLAKEDVAPNYRIINNYPKDKLKFFDKEDGVPSKKDNPDGVLQIFTDKDNVVRDKMINMKNANRSYNGARWNCTNFVMEGLKVINKNAEVYEPVSYSIFGIFDALNGVAATPNSLYKKSSSVFNSYEIQNPGSAINNRFQDVIK